MDNNQNTNMENTTEKVSFIDKAKGFIKNHKKGVAIGLLAILGAGAAGAVAASKKNRSNDEDDISDVSWKDLEDNEEATEPESTTSDVE